MDDAPQFKGAKIMGKPRGLFSRRFSSAPKSLFSEGMTWVKFFQGEIEIDHKRPVASFVFSSPRDEQFKQCWALSNLRPLWKRDNRIIGGSVRRRRFEA
jgi:hypothetical protein